MEVINYVCCGLDVHKKSITAGMLTAKGKEILTFATMTSDIICMIDWIKSKGCKNVALETTGVYWKPIYNLLEAEDIETLVVNVITFLTCLFIGFYAQELFVSIHSYHH